MDSFFLKQTHSVCLKQMDFCLWGPAQIIGQFVCFFLLEYYRNEAHKLHLMSKCCHVSIVMPTWKYYKVSSTNIMSYVPVLGEIMGSKSCQSLYLPFIQDVPALGQLALHALVFALAVLTQTVAEASATCKAERKNGADYRDWSTEKQHSLRLVFLKNVDLDFWLVIAHLFESTKGFAAGFWRIKFYLDFLALLLNPETGVCQAGGKEMYLPDFVMSGGFVAREDLLLSLENEQKFCTGCILQSLWYLWRAICFPFDSPRKAR